MSEGIPIPRGIRPDKSTSNTRGDGEFLSSYCNRIRSVLDYLASKSEVSFRWYTHTNPAGCWICDTFTAAYAILRELQNISHEIESGTRERAEDGVPAEIVETEVADGYCEDRGEGINS